MAGSILVSRSLAETRSAPAAMISLVLRAQVWAQRCTQPGQTWSGRLRPSPFLARRADPARPDARQDFLADLGHQTVEFRLGHEDAFFAILLLDVHDLLDPRLVPAAGERGGDPGAQDLFRLGLGQEPRAERKYIRIIVFAAISGGSFIIAQGRADARNLVGRHATNRCPRHRSRRRARPRRRPPVRPP